MGRPRRILILEGHPDPSDQRFCHALAAAYAAGAGAAGHELRTLRLGQLEISCLASRQDWEGKPPAPAIEACQRDLAWADHVVILYPLWLGDVPAKLKALLEQVLRPGFAFDPRSGPKESRIRGRSARLVVTMGMPGWIYRLWFGAHSVRSLKRNILAFCGLAPVRVTLIGSVEKPGAGYRRAWLERLEALGRKGI